MISRVTGKCVQCMSMLVISEFVDYIVENIYCHFTLHWSGCDTMFWL